MRLLPFLLLVFLGCDSNHEDEGVQLNALPFSGRVELTLQNRSTVLARYNLCYPELYSTRDPATAIDYGAPAAVCTAELRPLGPGASTTATVPVTQPITPGTYRFATWVEMRGDSHRVWSNTFEMN